MSVAEVFQRTTLNYTTIMIEDSRQYDDYCSNMHRDEPVCDFCGEYESECYCSDELYPREAQNADDLDMVVEGFGETIA